MTNKTATASKKQTGNEISPKRGKLVPKTPTEHLTKVVFDMIRLVCGIINETVGMDAVSEDTRNKILDIHRNISKADPSFYKH